MSTEPDVSFSAFVKKVATTLKEEKDPETKETIGYHTETKVDIQALGLEDETLRMIAALQSDGELVVSISRRQRVLFKGDGDRKAKEAH